MREKVKTMEELFDEPGALSFLGGSLQVCEVI